MAAPKAPSSRLADYDMHFIDKGAFGAVYKAVRRTDSRVFALKQVDLSLMKERTERAMAIDEARMLAQLNHPYVVKYYDSFIDSENRLNILMEFASKGSLKGLLKTYNSKPMPEDGVWRVLIQSLVGLNYLHSKKIIHRDIKSANLFIDSKNNIKIGDLGIARVLSASSNFARTRLGTPYYLAPELCEDKPYNTKTDVWALGIVMYECCMGCYPFDVENNNEAALYRKIMRGQFKPVQGPFSPALIQLVTSLLTFKPELRPDTSQLLRSPTLIAKAKALNIDLNPRPSASADDPAVYEGAAAAPQAAAPQPAAPQGPPGHPFAGAGSPGPAAGPYGSPQQQQPNQYPYQQGQVPYPPHHRPVSAGVAQQQGHTPPGGPAPSNHPFALAGQPGGGGYGSPPPYNSPQQGYGYGYGQQPQQQQAPPPRGAPMQAWGPQPPQQQPYQQQAPYGNNGRDPNNGNNNPWDRLAVDVNKMQLRESDVARINAERMQAAQANLHAGRQDHAKNVIYGGPQDSGPKPQRVAPEALPAAGRRPTSAHPGAAPFATHYDQGAGLQTQAQASMNEAWRATYQPPQYGRRRNPELQITGPSLRSTGARGGGGGGGRAGYVPAAEDATTYVSSTTYYTGNR
ncbi:hypothetical protein Agub_g5259 [Astrephomene gubernaculifera]|uniref:non-specific serine/threonine protein kinase n=1 Tax=Astrephomene gubernaculifera TaxID=47775 RepID=A0AAD3DLK9_9CHLO|nr:hypothetical protein Agub_g5259 [Astrephomene gubernaculifera]